MSEEGNILEDRLGGQMSFLAHLDEFRKRLVRCILVVGVAFVFCWFVKDYIYGFLEVPVLRALTEAKSRAVPFEGLTGKELEKDFSQLKAGNQGRYVFDRTTILGTSSIPPGTSVSSVVAKDSQGNLGLFTDENIYLANSIVPKGVKLPVNLSELSANESNSGEKLIFTTPMEPFQLYLLVSLYAAIALSVPFILYQVWGFISPALYPHEKKYVTPFVLLSSVSFLLGAAFAYYILFPPAVGYLLALGSDFTPFLKATDYFDFITLIMLAMGVIFQMPAVAYVLSRIGLINAGLLIRSWKIALIVILIVAAFVSPTGDVLNLMLFATPMMALYLVSIFVAWFFGKKRTPESAEDSF
ncbi:MAG: twin-arginine translocase subunit TatC [Pyrinomonadaceae bacterium]|nr:twin-arginine translocase subunit TatC [Pyrinomonadaceae bacterium]